MKVIHLHLELRLWTH